MSSILEQRIRGVQEESGLAETGRVLSVGYVELQSTTNKPVVPRAIARHKGHEPGTIYVTASKNATLHYSYWTMLMQTILVMVSPVFTVLPTCRPKSWSSMSSITDLNRSQFAF